jgi:methylated-DNA-[protein]-cysteine S-methyltransferase
MADYSSRTEHTLASPPGLAIFGHRNIFNNDVRKWRAIRPIAAMVRRVNMKVTAMKETKRTGTGPVNHYSVLKSPVGGLMLVADASALTGVYFADRDHIPAERKHWILDPQHPVLRRAEQELNEYFAGKRKTFSVPLRPKGTEFQQKVWREIARVPHGETATYSDLAKGAGSPAAVRAAGTSTGRNPIAIIVPCHRIIGKDGTLCGFAGGLDKKRFLLALEDPGVKSLRRPSPTRP